MTVNSCSLLRLFQIAHKWGDEWGEIEGGVYGTTFKIIQTNDQINQSIKSINMKTNPNPSFPLTLLHSEHRWNVACPVD